ncbi:hypothetical protein TNCV_4398311 [Trichonephila clavipes]|nr:hypothetical protein TNCV_4398311 [Trichonephila clavipes]
MSGHFDTWNTLLGISFSQQAETTSTSRPTCAKESRSVVASKPFPESAQHLFYPQEGAQNTLSFFEEYNDPFGYSAHPVILDRQVLS